MSQCLQVEGEEKDHQKDSGSQATPQMHGNWEQNEVLVFVKCKHLEHVAQKQLIDPRTHMVPAATCFSKT
jgi:hypothetical protein